MCGFDGRRIPTVAEAEHGLIDRHHVDDEIVVTPSTERRALGRVFP